MLLTRVLVVVLQVFKAAPWEREGRSWHFIPNNRALVCFLSFKVLGFSVVGIFLPEHVGRVNPF